MKNILLDKFEEIDVNKDGSINLYEFLWFFLRFPKFNEELLVNARNNAPYTCEEDLSVWQLLRLRVYFFIECPNCNLAAKVLFCFDLILGTVPVVMLLIQATSPSFNIDWGEDNYLWAVSVFFAFQYLLGLVTCRNSKKFVMDL